MIKTQRRIRIRDFKRVLSLLLTAIVSIAFIPTPLFSAEYQYSYPIHGTTVQELMEQIKQQSHSPDGAFGYTELKTHVGWTAIVEPDGKCTVETVDFSYDISIYMPDWVNKHSAKQCLQDNWDTVWYEIQIHEEQHRNLYRLLDVNDINQRIMAIKPRSSCNDLELAINSEIEKILDANDKLHDYFHAANAPATIWDC